MFFDIISRLHAFFVVDYSTLFPSFFFSVLMLKLWTFRCHSEYLGVFSTDVYSAYPNSVHMIYTDPTSERQLEARNFFNNVASYALFFSKAFLWLPEKISDCAKCTVEQPDNELCFLYPNWSLSVYVYAASCRWSQLAEHCRRCMHLILNCDMLLK